MKKLVTSLTAGLLVLGAQSLFAQSTNSTPGTETPHAHKALTAEQRQDRQKAMELIGLNRKDLKGLTPKERNDKIKEAVDKYLADEKAKKEAGTFTAEDQKNVDLVKKTFEHHKKSKAVADSQ